MLGRLFSLLRIVVSWTYLALVTVVFVPFMLMLLPSRRLRICVFNLYGWITGCVMVALAGATLPPGLRPQIRAKYPAIYVSNHTSYLDNFIAAWIIPIGTIGLARSGTQWVPFFGNLYALSGHILVNRTDRRAAAAALRTMIEVVQRHRLSAGLWPEGGRSADGRLRPFKRGFVHLALATRLPIVPIVVSGAHHCWTKGSFFTRRAFVNVQVLPAIATDHWSATTIEQHVEEVRARFIAALPPDQRPVAAPISPVFRQ